VRQRKATPAAPAGKTPRRGEADPVLREVEGDTAPRQDVLPQDQIDRAPECGRYRRKVAHDGERQAPAIVGDGEGNVADLGDLDAATGAANDPFPGWGDIQTLHQARIDDRSGASAV
jgi:hypothetical protein